MIKDFRWLPAQHAQVICQECPLCYLSKRPDMLSSIAYSRVWCTGAHCSLILAKVHRPAQSRANDNCSLISSCLKRSAYRGQWAPLRGNRSSICRSLLCTATQATEPAKPSSPRPCMPWLCPLCPCRYLLKGSLDPPEVILRK